MSLIKLRNFDAASRKRNMVAFGLFPLGTDLSWIQNEAESTGTVQTATYGSTVTFSWDQSRNWQVTLTGDVVTAQILNAGSSTDFDDGDTIVLKIIQDATGYRNFPLPATVRRVTGYSISDDPSTMTTLQLQWRSSAWDFLVPPLESPAT